jgi:hypothetical protein
MEFGQKEKTTGFDFCMFEGPQTHAAGSAGALFTSLLIQ